MKRSIITCDDCGMDHTEDCGSFIELKSFSTVVITVQHDAVQWADDVFSNEYGMDGNNRPEGLEDYQDDEETRKTEEVLHFCRHRCMANYLKTIVEKAMANIRSQEDRRPKKKRS